MSSTSISSTPTPEPTSQPPALNPRIDWTALAKTTRKTLERLVPFSHMRTSSSETSPRLTKIINKIKHYTTLIDSSMLCQQLGYQLANNCMLLCDPELSAGLSTPGEAITGRRHGAWTPVGVSRQPGVVDVCVFGREDACELAGKGHDLALKVKEGFSGIAQDMYKIAASTKDDMLVVLVPPDPVHSETLKIHLKDVGTNLVANLRLLSEFSKAISEAADWWSSVKDDLTLDEPSLLVPTFPHGDEAKQEIENIEGQKCAWWTEMKDGFQAYYGVINVAHVRFPELLPSSSAAWQSVTSASSQSPSSTEHSNNPHQSKSSPFLAGPSTKGHREGARCFRSFMLGWKWVDKGKREEEMKPEKRLVKRKESKKNKHEIAQNGKNTKEKGEDEMAKKNSTPQSNETETGDENNTRTQSSQEDKPKVRLG